MDGDGQPAAQHAVSARFDDLGRDGAPCRLGIFGGTFDPIHAGHMAAAAAAQRACGLDAVIFMPSGRPPFKQGSVVASPEQRLAMCRLAISEDGNPAFDVSDLEVRAQGIAYTIDTLRTLRAHYPRNVDLVFILGADALLTLLDWRAPDDLKGIASFVALSRPGYQLDDATRARLREAGCDVTELDETAVEASSSDVRSRLARGLPVEGCVPRAVRGYIEEHGLYQGPEMGKEAR